MQGRPAVRQVTTADVHIERFYRPIMKSLQPRKPSVLEQLRAAKTVEELQVIVGDSLVLRASSDTRRKWRELAEARISQLRVQVLVTR